MQSVMHCFTHGVVHFRNSEVSAPVQPSHSLLLPSHLSSHWLLHSGAQALSLVIAMTDLEQSSPLKPSLHMHLPSLVLHLPLSPPPHSGVGALLELTGALGTIGMSIIAFTGAVLAGTDTV